MEAAAVNIGPPTGFEAVAYIRTVLQCRHDLQAVKTDGRSPYLTKEREVEVQEGTVVCYLKVQPLTLRWKPKKAVATAGRDMVGKQP